MEAQDVRQTERQRDADPSDGRDETEDERMDRNWGELLQELRVTQTGTQILTAFLLTIAFQPTFSQLDDFERTVYLVLVSVAAVTTALGLAPVNLHRALFRQHAKADLVRVGHVIVHCTLGGVGIVLTGTVLLVYDVVLGQTAGILAAAGTLMVLAAIVIMSTRLRRRR
jgi:Family of unknown function (DUF6328)